MDKVFHEEGEIEGVIHFAAYKSVEESVKIHKSITKIILDP